jgi:hypothetical protein
MPPCRRRCVAAFLIIGFLWNGSAVAQERDALAGRWCDLALTKDSEAGFERFLHMAQTGQLGKDVSNANVGVFKNYARLELVRGNAPKKVFLLTPRTSATRVCRYFTIEPGDGATASDVARVGHALDEAFGEDPFQLAYDFFNAPPGGDPLPSLVDAWESGGWHGVVRGLERRMAALAGIQYTIAVIVALTVALLASLLLLWASGGPPPSRIEPRTDSQ